MSSLTSTSTAPRRRPGRRKAAQGGLSGHHRPVGSGKPGAAEDPLEACVAGSQGESGKQPETPRERARSAP